MNANQDANRICIEGAGYEQFHNVVGDMLETIESLRTAATTFPDGYSTATGEMNPVITVKIFADAISKQLDKLYGLATNDYASVPPQMLGNQKETARESGHGQQ